MPKRKIDFRFGHLVRVHDLHLNARFQVAAIQTRIPIVSERTTADAERLTMVGWNQLETDNRSFKVGGKLR